MSKKLVLDILRSVFTDTYGLYLKTQSYHWNVTGPHFYSYHLLFEEQYKEMQGAVDVLAERFRTLGETLPISFDFFKHHSAIKFEGLPKNAQEMIRDLIIGHQVAMNHLKELIEAAHKESDSATEDLAINRLGVHEKALWVLQSSL